jgi:hypothetical protein
MTTARVGKTLGGISTAVGQSAPISSMTPGTINAISDAASAVIPQDAPTTLDMIVNARQLPPPTMPRDWDLVKSDPELMNELANRAEALGIIPAMQFGMMSEPMKKQLHTAVIQAAPQFAEQIPGGYNVINNQYMNPMERDAAISSVMDKPAAERARVAGAALTNKFQAPSNTSSIGAQPKFALPATIDKLNSSLDSVLQPRIDTPLDTSYDNSSSSMMDELDRAIMLHGVN